jgi:hypothetical protein
VKTSPVTAVVNIPQAEIKSVLPSHLGANIFFSSVALMQKVIIVASGYVYFLTFRETSTTLGQLYKIMRSPVTAITNLAYAAFDIAATPQGAAYPSDEINELAPEELYFDSQPVGAIQPTASAEAEIASKILHKEANQIAVSLSTEPDSFLDMKITRILQGTFYIHS